MVPNVNKLLQPTHTNMKKLLLLVFIILGFSHLSFSQWKSFSSTNVPQLPDAEFSAIVLDESNNLWFATSGGLVLFDGSNWSVFTSSSNNLADNIINDAQLSTQDNSLWLATPSGVSEVSLNGAEVSGVTNFNSSGSGLLSDMVYSVGVNLLNFKSFGTSKGLSIYENSIWSGLQDMTEQDSIRLILNPVVSIRSTGDNTFLGTQGTGVYVTTNEVDGISTVTNWVTPYNIPNSDNINDVFLDPAGNQWFATDQGAVYHEGLAAQSDWSDPLTTSEGLPDNMVNAVFVDDLGYVWFGTENGLALLKNEQFTIYTTSDGLISNNVLDIIEDDLNQMWFATDNGISRFRPEWHFNSVPGQISGYFDLNVHPNPTSAGAWIRYDLPESGMTSLSITDLAGRLIYKLENGFKLSGRNEIFWNSRDQDGNFVDQGIFIVRLQSGAKVSTQKIIVLR